MWSVTEYAAHVRDVHEVFAQRLDLMLGAAEDRPPEFANWDQDAAALEGRYDLAQPAAVAAVLSERADAVAAAYDAVEPAAYDRVGHRSNGSTFTVLTLARYHLHDLVHHLWDVRRELTVAAYDARTDAYAVASAAMAPAGAGRTGRASPPSWTSAHACSRSAAAVGVTRPPWRSAGWWCVART